MINISQEAQDYFRGLLETQGGDAVGIRLLAIDPGTARADARLEFCENEDLTGEEWSVECSGFMLYVDAPSAPYLEGAQIDFSPERTGGQLTIRAPRIKGEAPAEDAGMIERVRWVVENEVNPQLASHGGRVAVEEVTAEGVVLLRFGGGCHGCGMVDVTLKQGIEKTLLAKVPGLTAVRDATDHSTGDNPYFA